MIGTHCSLQAIREAILNRSSEHSEARTHTFNNATAVFDLLAIALVRKAHFHKLVDVSRAVKGAEGDI